jgi:hypothetical protein
MSLRGKARSPGCMKPWVQSLVPSAPKRKNDDITIQISYNLNTNQFINLLSMLLDTFVKHIPVPLLALFFKSETNLKDHLKNQTGNNY